MECSRAKTYAAFGLPCPGLASEVIVRKVSGDVKMVICEEHIKAYRAAGLVVIR